MDAQDRAAEAPSAGEAGSDLARLAKGAGLMVPGRILGRGLTLLAQVLLARGLGQEAFGLFTIAWTFLRTGEFVGPLGLEQGVVRFGSDVRRTDPSMHKKVMLLSLGSASAVSLAFGLMILLSASWLAVSFFGEPALAPLLRIVAIGLLFAAGLNVAAAATRVSLRMQYAFLAQEAVQPGVLLLLVAGYLYAGHALEGVTTGVVLSYAAGFGVALIALVRLFPEAFRAPWTRQPILRALLGFSAITWAARVFNTGLINSDRILVGRFMDAADVGLYQAASQVATLFPIIIAAFSAILTPLFSDLHHRGARERLAQVYRMGSRWGLYACLPFFLIVTLGAPELVELVYGSPYALAWVPLVILTVAQICFVLSNAPGLLLMMVGRQKAWLAVCGAAFVVGVAAQIGLIPRWGLAGAAAGMTAGMLTLAAGGLGVVRVTLKMWPIDREYLKGLAAAACAGLFILGLRVIGLTSSFGFLALGTIISLAVFVLVLACLGLEAEEAALVRSVLARLPGARRLVP